MKEGKKSKMSHVMFRLNSLKYPFICSGNVFKCFPLHDNRNQLEIIRNIRHRLQSA